MENKTIGLSVLLVILGSLAGIYGTTVFDDDAYYCEATSSILVCDRLSKYYDLPNGKCYNPEGNKLCRSGWLKITDDVVKSLEATPVIKSSNGGTYICSHEECVPKIG